MRFKVVQGADGDWYLCTEDNTTACRLQFFDGGRYKNDILQWLKPLTPTETKVMIEELVHTIECLTNRYTQIYPERNQMPWYWVRAEQAIEKAKEWLGNVAEI